MVPEKKLTWRYLPAMAGMCEMLTGSWPIVIQNIVQGATADRSPRTVFQTTYLKARRACMIDRVVDCLKATASTRCVYLSISAIEWECAIEAVRSALDELKVVLP